MKGNIEDTGMSDGQATTTHMKQAGEENLVNASNIFTAKEV